ncbi:MAG: hypothetical protein HY784_01095 [Chloroflexi bacterium]|nr:hypothetical protein [Chloroflexota bacterium]
MARTLKTTDPNLLGGVNRLGQAQQVWGGLFLLFGLLNYIEFGTRHPLTGLSWIILGGLCFAGPQPLLLMAVAVQMAFSLLLPLAQIALLFGPDPLASALGAGRVELAGMLLVRAVMLFTAANQFFFYRLLYGTAGADGLDPDLPAIPPMVPNRADRYAALARFCGLTSLLACGAAFGLARTGFWPLALELAGVSGVLAVGPGLGAALSPTRLRGAALLGTAAGLGGYLLAPILLAQLLRI